MQRVLEVTSVDLSLVKTKPPQIHIVTHGTVPTSGWKHPRLSPWFYIRPPDDGIQDFDFVADAPTGIVLPMITTIVAEATIPRDPEDYWGPCKALRGVRIHARTNTKEASFNAAEDLAQAISLFRGDDDPIPWLIVTATASDCDLTGKVLRVYHTGDGITDDYRTDRGNIELDPKTERVVRVWCG
ncbi:hypothetical protein BJ123_102222 [Rhodopseudomonas thermotolerans]|uniref:Uncharacterized protein n=2 Tax=Rhodopseudomonas TaxID=1073 RepID=A0A336JI14_9BRAD|nr:MULTISPECIES: hypothetical protein [Rhodopseudomonas]RED42050.1 hypothetical protein BJ125_102220 [Rhodopseudomonas pentothenatexigens]REG07511.1 hypothetical protein BJ123_102222 [Rhodopseudomonas thermotolerans]SSW89410.1 hypothetical protein SAMN05892882_102220 [Rhodopseudomonas pentothenatexigens]